MTLRNFPPADACDPEDLDAIADLVVRDPHASYDLAGSREHLEALCRRYQALAQDLARTESYLQAEQRATKERDAAIAALERALAAATNDRDVLRAGFEEGTARVASELAAARQAIADREDEIARTNNERQAEVLAAEAERERADTAESIAEIFEATARAALAILASGTNTKPVDLAELVRAVDGRLARALVREQAIGRAFSARLEQAMQRLEAQQQTHAANDRIRSAFASSVPAICDGVTVEELDAKLDAELAAHPDVVCMTCRDTHTMMLGDRDVMCTRCPTPCERCRSRTPGAGPGPYCATTPCACGCHGSDYPRPPGPLHHARDQRDHQEDTTP